LASGALKQFFTMLIPVVKRIEASRAKDHDCRASAGRKMGWVLTLLSSTAAAVIDWVRAAAAQL
jgi:hypothetical protein